MKIYLGIGTACLAGALALPAAFGQPAAARARSASSNDMGSEVPHLGVGGQDVNSDRAKNLKLKEDRGVEVTSVEPEGAAAKAGLKDGDVILEFNGQKVEGWEHLKRLVRETPIHRDVKIVVWRNGAEQTLSASMGSQREFQVDLGNLQQFSPPSWVQPMPAPAAPIPPQFELHTFMGTSSLGIMGEALGQESQLAEYFGVKEGVLVRSVSKDSAAEKAGMKAGDVITKIEDTAISSPQQIGSALRAARNKSTVNVTVMRNKREITLSVTPETNSMYRGGIWNPGYDVWMNLLQPAQARKIAQ